MNYDSLLCTKSIKWSHSWKLKHSEKHLTKNLYLESSPFGIWNPLRWNPWSLWQLSKIAWKKLWLAKSAWLNHLPSSSSKGCFEAPESASVAKFWPEFPARSVIFEKRGFHNVLERNKRCCVGWQQLLVGATKAGKPVFLVYSCYVFCNSLHLEQNKVGIALLHGVKCFEV